MEFSTTIKLDFFRSTSSFKRLICTHAHRTRERERDRKLPRRQNLYVQWLNMQTFMHALLFLYREKYRFFLPQFIFRPKIGYVYHIEQGMAAFCPVSVAENISKQRIYQQLMCDINQELVQTIRFAFLL